VNRADHLGVVGSLQVDRGDTKVGVPELALDYVERHALPRHLDRVRMTQLVRREPAPDACSDREMTKLLSRSRARPWSPPGGTVDDAEDRSDGHLGAVLGPRTKLLPAPIVHAGFSSLTTLASADEKGAAAGIEIRFGQIQRFADAKPGAPQNDD
jgi:hypothetical protein